MPDFYLFLSQFEDLDGGTGQGGRTKSRTIRTKERVACDAPSARKKASLMRALIKMTANTISKKLPNRTTAGDWASSRFEYDGLDMMLVEQEKKREHKSQAS